MKILKWVVGVLCLVVISSSTWAFMPASGIWQIDSETNGSPGRGFTIDVENEVMFFTYYGYRADGSSLFYVAAGPIISNTFTGDLLDVQGGTTLGAAYRPAILAPSPGKVALTFTSGKHGAMTLPGESPKAISKNNFGYPDGPDGLLGTWLLTMIIGTSPFTDRVNLNTKLGATSAGNGLVSTATGNYGCEFQVSGNLAGMVACVNTKSNPDRFAFKFSGDRATGFDLYGANLRVYEAHATRISTKTGAMTGLNDSTIASTQAKSAVRHTMSSAVAPDPLTELAKASADAIQVSTAGSEPDKAAALAVWESEVRSIISRNNN